MPSFEVPPTVAYLAAAASGTYLVAKLLKVGRRSSDLPPGPPTFPLVGNLLDFPTSDVHRALTKWGNEFGDVCSLKIGSGNMIILSSPAAMRDVLDKQAGATSDRPPLHIADVITDGLHLPFLRAGPEWKVNRRTVRDILSPQACMRHLQIQIAESSRLMYDLLRSPEEHYTHFQRYALSVIMCVTFGQSVVNIHSPETEEFVRNAHDFNHIMGIGVTPPVDLIPLLKYVPERWAWWKTACRDIRTRHTKYYGKLMKPCQDRAANGQESRCFIQSILEKKVELGITDHMTRVLGQAILETGSDTSGAYLQNATLLLQAHPHVQKKAQEELDRVVGSDRAPTLDDMKDLPYVRAIIEEIHRIRPVAPVSIPHYTTADLNYRGFTIPKESTIMPNVYGAFHDASLFHNPEVFDPDRYLANPFGVSKGPAEWSSVPLKDFVYGFGKRACPGMILAKNTIALNIANMLWGFDFLKTTGPDGRPIEPDLDRLKPQLVLVTPPFACDIRPRSARHADIMRQNFLDYATTSIPFEQELNEEDKKFIEGLREEAANALRSTKVAQ